MGKIEARNISVTANIKVSNPNWFAIKIKPSDLDAYIENQYMGKIFLEKKVKMHAKSKTVLSLPLRAELADGAMITALKYATKEKVALHVKGKVKAGVWFISKKFDVDETKTIFIFLDIILCCIHIKGVYFLFKIRKISCIK